MEKESFFGKNYQKFTIGKIANLTSNLKLSSSVIIKDFPIAYQTYGELNQQRSNAILICHALTGDQFVASKHPVTGKDGWWQHLIGAGKAIDTNKYFVICSNVIGGCMGSFGPKEINPQTNKPYNLDFPIITIADMVNAQKILIEEFFGIKKLHAVIGGSMGGMQALQWGSKYPEMVGAVAAIASSSRHTAQNIAFHEVGRQAIMADQNWHNGSYLDHHSFPEKGLSVARMAAHITYLSEEALTEKFGRNLQNKEIFSFNFSGEFQIESYLKRQGVNFVDRFDANSYLYITKAVDYFDLSSSNDGLLENAFINSAKVKFCLISFSDDWLFPTSEAKLILRALNYIGASTNFIEISSNRGHDSFFLPHRDFEVIIQAFIENI